MLALDAQQVMALRLAKLSTGDATASREARRMVSEKAIAFGEAAAHVAAGGSMRSVVTKYRRKVRSNRRRLTR
jgi:hypothetical protein